MVMVIDPPYVCPTSIMVAQVSAMDCDAQNGPRVTACECVESFCGFNNIALWNEAKDDRSQL